MFRIHKEDSQSKTPLQATGHQDYNAAELQSSGGFDLRGSHQISAQVRLLGTLPAEIKKVWDIVYNKIL